MALSIGLKNNTEFLTQFFVWRKDALFFSQMEMFLACALPLAMIGRIVDVVGILTKRASVLRNAVDLIHLILMIWVIVLKVQIAPIEKQIIEDSSATAAYGSFMKLQQTLCLVQGALFLIPIVRYNDVPPAAPRVKSE